MIIFVGNIGSGKSLIASKLAAKGYVIVSMDAIQSMIAGGKKDLYHTIESTAIESALRLGLNVVIDCTNMNSKRRERFIDLAKKYQAEPICYHFGIGNRTENIANRMKESHDMSEKSWGDVFDLMAIAYDKPNVKEGFSVIIEMPKKSQNKIMSKKQTIYSKGVEVGLTKKNILLMQAAFMEGFVAAQEQTDPVNRMKFTKKWFKKRNNLIRLGHSYDKLQEKT